MAAVKFPRGGLVEQVLPAAATREQWQQVRQSGCGGTDAAAIAGVNPWSTPLDVYLAKTGQAAPREPTEEMRWGTLLESLVAGDWAGRHGRKLQRVGLLRDALRPHRMGSLDRVVLEPGTRTAAAVWEGKTTSARNDSEWTAGVWGDFGRLPAMYLCQVQWYLGITGLDLAHVACLLGGQRLTEVTVPFDPVLFDALAADVDAFWERHIEGHQPPDPTVADLPRLAELYPQLVDDPVELDPPTLHAVEDYATGKSAIKRLETELADDELAIKTALGEHTTGTRDGTPIVTWRTQSRRDLDRKALRADQPEIYAKYETTGTVRVLRLTGTGKGQDQ